MGGHSLLWQVRSSRFEEGVAAIVMANVVVMAATSFDGRPRWVAQLADGADALFTSAFVVEMALKLLGMGCAAYWADGWNQLDGVIVSLSIVEMVITVLLADTGVNISFLRMLRLLRLLRLLKAWPALYQIVLTMADGAARGNSNPRLSRRARSAERPSFESRRRQRCPS